MDPAGRDLDKAAAALIVLLTPILIPGHEAIHFGTLPAAVIAVPILMTALAHRAVRLLIALMVVSAGFGLLLAQMTAYNSAARSIDAKMEHRLVFGLITAALALAALLWARTLLKDRTMLILFGAGGLTSALLNSAIYSTNPWKFGLAWPVTVLALGIAGAHRGRILAVLAGVVLVSASNDYRTFIGFALITALVVLLPASRTAHASSGRALLGMAVIVLLIYQVAVQASLHGVLGPEIQLRTEQQSGAAGSVLLAARPEWSATFQLVRDRPLGFGPGVVPGLRDVQLARTGIAQVRGEATGDYVNTYLFGGHLELHSMAGDLWVNFGLPGLAFAVTLFFYLLRGFGAAVVGRSPVLVFIALVGLWDTLFSPMSALYTTLFAVAMLLPLGKAQKVEHSDGDADSDETGGGAKPEVVLHTARH